MDDKEFLEELEFVVDVYINHNDTKLTKEGKEFKRVFLKIISKIPHSLIASSRGYHDVDSYYEPDDDDFSTSD